MSKLDELLSPEPTDVEVQVAADVGIQPLTISEYRIRLGRQFLQEAAKLVCPYCQGEDRPGMPSTLYCRFKEPFGQYYHVRENTQSEHPCYASAIHARLAKEKP